MFLLNYIRDLDRKFSWSFLGFVLAFFFGTLAIYDRFLAEKNRQLYFDVLTNTAVMDIKEDVPTLDIFFDGVNIKQQNQSLRIMSIRIVNDSSRDILKGLYDPKDLLGFRLSHGKIIRVNVIKTSNEYLSRNLSLAIDKNNTIILPEVIIEAGESFVVKMMILHASNETPTIIPTGHIAGMKAILIRELYREGEVLPFWTRVFSDSIWIHIVRLIIYVMIVITIFLAIFVPFVTISNMFYRAKLKKNVQEFKATTSLSLNETDDYIFSKYVERGEGVLSFLKAIDADKNEFDRRFNVYRRKIQKRSRNQHFIPMANSQHIQETVNHFVLFLDQKELKKTDESAKQSKASPQ